MSCIGAPEGVSSMSHIDFKKWQRPLRLSLLFRCRLKQTNVPCRIQGKAHVMSVISILMSMGSMSRVHFKKCLCRRVHFKGQGPLYSVISVWNYAGTEP